MPGFDPRSIIDHRHIIKALKDRGADLAARLSRKLTLGLAAHVEKDWTYLNEGQRNAASG